MFQFEFETALFKFTAPPQRSPLLQLPSTIAKEVTKRPRRRTQDPFVVVIYIILLFPVAWVLSGADRPRAPIVTA